MTNPCLLIWAAIGLIAAAEAASPAAVAPQDDSALHNQAFAIGRELRCPVCQGMPIAESPSTMARDMMKRVGELLREGKSQQDIYAYFVERYGEWVLLDPPRHGFTAWVWVAPPLLLLGALIWAVLHMRRLRQPMPASPEPSLAVDPYVQAVRDEVDR